MKLSTYLLAVCIMAMGCQTKQAEQAIVVTEDIPAESDRTLLAGSDASLTISCSDSCEIVFQKLKKKLL